MQWDPPAGLGGAKEGCEGGNASNSTSRNYPLPTAGPPPGPGLAEALSMILVDKCGNPYPPLKSGQESFPALGGFLFVSVVRINPAALA